MEESEATTMYTINLTMNISLFLSPSLSIDIHEYYTYIYMHIYKYKYIYHVLSITQERYYIICHILCFAGVRPGRVRGAWGGGTARTAMGDLRPTWGLGPFAESH